MQCPYLALCVWMDQWFKTTWEREAPDDDQKGATWFGLWDKALRVWAAPPMEADATLHSEDSSFGSRCGGLSCSRQESDGEGELHTRRDLGPPCAHRKFPDDWGQCSFVLAWSCFVFSVVIHSFLKCTPSVQIFVLASRETSFKTLAPCVLRSWFWWDHLCSANNGCLFLYLACLCRASS